jgi:uncharacterized protein
MKRKHFILLGVSLSIILLSAVFIYEKSYKNNDPPIDELKLLANQGDMDAQNKLGAAYFNGKGIEKNAAEAQRWFTQSAQKG